jgi:serine protease Do
MNLGMKWHLLGVALLAALSAPAQESLPAGTPIDLQHGQEIKLAPPANDDIRRDATVQAVERAMPSVVNIATENIRPVRDPMQDYFEQYFNPYYRGRAKDDPYSLGSGVIISEDGYVLTNDHVVQRANKIWVKLAENGEVYEARLVSTSPNKDTALLKILAPAGVKFTAVKFAAEDDLLLGETVLALGNPYNLGGSVSRGILSSKSRVEARGDEPLSLYNCLQTDASINPGNSGGPLVNLHGDLIGLNAVILKDAQGIGFAIPVTQIHAALSGLITPEAMKQIWFGARIKSGTLPARVLSVQPGSPAALAGLLPGDEILSVNGASPKDLFDLNELLIASPHGEAQLATTRNGTFRPVRVRLIPEASFFNADLIRRKLGVTISEQNISTQAAANLHLASTNALVVTDVDTNAPAAKSLLRGFLITSIDGETPSDLVAAAKLLYAKQAGETARLGVLAQLRQDNLTYTTQDTLAVPVR